ncbi:response regulator [Tellurirhabdus bombi]|uniref:response regulator n=1 Tax=Tellurirhabdus bombi TaxID=2907205 RepID=UPI001F18D250|nr:response regulator [Tellurirhabdus bombi]
MKVPLRILIVEDVPLTAISLEEHLTQAGYIVCGKATDYESAIRLMKKESPDLALIDIQLDGQPDGIVTAQELLRIKPIPIIYLTGHPESEYFARAKKTKPAAFLHKPIRLRELAMQVDLALHNYYLDSNTELASISDYVYIPDGHSKYRVHQNGIAFLRANRAYVDLFLTSEEYERLKIKTKNVPLTVSVSLGKMLEYLPTHFYKISRSVAINLNHLERIETTQIVIGEEEIDLPEGAYKKLIERLNVVRFRR